MQGPLKLLALLPIPVIIALVIWAGRRPPKPQPQPKRSAAAKVPDGEVRLPPGPAPGWTAAGTIKRFDKKTLFDRINGAAPPYIAAGFRYSLGGEYRKAGQKEPVTVDAYDMGTARRAFGMYARERDPSYTFSKIGDEGYLASGSLNFWRGRFYVKLAGYEEGAAADRALGELALALAKALPAEQAAVAQVRAALGRLPAEEQVPRSAGFSLPPLDGIAGLASAYVARYRVGGKEDGAEYRLLVVPLADQAASEARLTAATKHLGGQDGAKVERYQAKLVKATEPGNGARVMIDGKVCFFVATPAGLAAGLDLPDAKVAQAAEQQLLAALAGSPSGQTKAEEKP